jgi:hypothetical protein
MSEGGGKYPNNGPSATSARVGPPNILTPSADITDRPLRSAPSIESGLGLRDMGRSFSGSRLNDVGVTSPVGAADFEGGCASFSSAIGLEDQAHIEA